MEQEQCQNEHERIQTLEEVVFGNERTGELGIKQKVDEIHEILVQAKGLKGVLYLLIAIGGAIAMVKGIFR